MQALCIFFMLTTFPHIIFSAHSKPQSQEMSVAHAVKEVAQILSGSALKTAERKINEQSIGGMTIDRQVFQNIIQETLEHDVPKGIAEKPTMGITHVTIDPKGTLEVPVDIKGKVFYLKVAQQGIDECGYRVIYNAKAFDELLKSQVLISQERLDSKANKLAKEWSIQECRLDDEGIKAQAIAQGFGNNSFIFSKSKITDGPRDDFFGGKIVEKFNDPSTAAQAFFFIHYKGHWVVAIALKDKNAKPVIMYMNSNNPPMTKESEAYKVLKALTEKLGA